MGLGMTKLEAVNELLYTVDDLPVAALDTDGSSEAAMAERVLDRVSAQIQAQGWPENTTRSKEYTPVEESGVFEVDLAANLLSVRPSGPTHYRNLVIRGTRLYDADRGSYDFLSTNKLYLDVIEELDFDDLQPDTKENIVAAARMIYQRRRQGSQATDAMLLQEYAMQMQTSRQQIAQKDKDRWGPMMALPPIVQPNEPQTR